METSFAVTDRRAGRDFSSLASSHVASTLWNSTELGLAEVSILLLFPTSQFEIVPRIREGLAHHWRSHLS